MERIRKDDQVKVIAGKDAGKVGRVVQVLRERGRVMVEGVNYVKKHQRMQTQSGATEGGIIETEAIAQALLLREVTGTPLAQTLHEFLADKHLLLVLDNFEQVSEAAPRIAELLTAAPRVKVLASSREPLRLYGEQEFPVPPLAVPDVNHLPTPDLLEMYPAVDLFAQRAQAVRPGFAINAQNATAIAHICAWLDGLPLALEIAAAHVKWKSPAALLGQLRQQLMGLTGSQRDLTPRQQTLRGAIDWSYKLLSWAEQELLMALSVTNGGCGLAVAAELSGNDQATCDRLVRGLAEKSLLQ